MLLSISAGLCVCNVRHQLHSTCNMVTSVTFDRRLPGGGRLVRGGREGLHHGPQVHTEQLSRGIGAIRPQLLCQVGATTYRK